MHFYFDFFGWVELRLVRSGRMGEWVEKEGFGMEICDGGKCFFLGLIVGLWEGEGRGFVWMSEVPVVKAGSVDIGIASIRVVEENSRIQCSL